MGDAVASIAPLCGDGIAMALRSAELGASGADAYLRGVTSLQAWEVAHRRAWRDECERRCRTGRFLQTVLGAPLLSDVFVSAARAVPSLARYFVSATRGPVHPADVSGLG
jgi:flavin-dependent dehydrogenase